MLSSKGGDILQYCYIVSSSDELYHHGVKGMHWGVRRYQNENGSLNLEGRAKLYKYRKKQVKRVSESYSTAKNNMNSQISFIKKKIDKKNKKGKNTDRLNKKLDKYKTKYAQLSAEGKAAIDKAKHMKIEDIGAAKRQVAAKVVKKALLVGGAGAAGSAVGFGGLYALGVHNILGLGSLPIYSLNRAAVAGATSASLSASRASQFSMKPSFTNLTRDERVVARSKAINGTYNKKKRK